MNMNMYTRGVGVRIYRRGPCVRAMLPPSAVALVQHHRLGNVDPRMGLTLAAGTAVGGWVGSGLAVEAPRGVLEGAFFFGMLFLSKKTFATIRKIK